MKTILLNIFIIGICFGAFETFAQCSCEPQLTLQEHFQRSDAVFVGKVITIEKVQKRNDKDFDIFIKFEVKQNWKNALEQFVTVKEIYGSTEGFEPNSEWLLYAFKDEDGALRIVRHCCSRTKLLSVAKKQGEIKALKKISEKPKTILEVREFGGGMVAVSGEYLFLRVLDNGRIEYEEFEIKDGKRILVSRKYYLSNKKLDEFREFLQSPELRTAKETYKPDVPIIDHIIRFNISINQSSKTQNIKLINYHPSLSDESDKYPAKLIELVCRIKALRAKSDFHILGNDCVNIRKRES